MKTKMLKFDTAMSGNRMVILAGDVVEYPAAEADSLIDAGIAFEHPGPATRKLPPPPSPEVQEQMKIDGKVGKERKEAEEKAAEKRTKINEKNPDRDPDSKEKDGKAREAAVRISPPEKATEPNARAR